MGSRIAFYFLIFFSISLWGQSQPTTKIQYAQELYSGEENKSFNREIAGSGVEMILSSKNAYFNYFTKGRFTVVSGAQDFLDNGTEVESDFTFYKSSFEVGANLYPLSRKAKQANLYIGLSGNVTYNYLSLDSESLTELKSTYQAMSFGYAGLMGVEWQIYDKFSITAEFSQKFETANLADVSKFSLNAFSIAVGIGW